MEHGSGMGCAYERGDRAQARGESGRGGQREEAQPMERANRSCVVSPRGPAVPNLGHISVSGGGRECEPGGKAGAILAPPTPSNAARRRPAAENNVIGDDLPTTGCRAP